MNALIVCQAGPGLGLGHLTRSLVTAQALRQELGADVHLLVQGDPIQRVDLNAFEHRFLGEGADLLDMIAQQARCFDIQAVILDLHPARVPAGIGRLLEELRQGHCKLVSVDGLLEQRDRLDLIFMPSFRFSAPEAPAGAAPILSGWDCYLLNVKRAPHEWQPGKRVLALTGGSDATGLGRTLPTLLDETLPSDADIHWVTGPYAQPPVWPPHARLRMLSHRAPVRLDELMVQSNYALTVYGVSFFELLYYGVPTVVFSPYGDKDAAELAAIAELRVARVAKNEADAVGGLRDLMADSALAASMSRNARERMATPGGPKLARAVAELLD